MGRMLDALRQATKEKPAPGTSPAEHAAPHGLHAVWPEESTKSVDDVMPFIEVGTGETVMSRGVGPAEVKREQRSQKSQSTAPSWMSVRFEPIAIERDREHGLASFAAELIVHHDPEHEISHQYRELTTGLVLQLPQQDSRVMLFTAPGRGAGTTTVMLNLALSLAQDNTARVLVVDAQLKNPSIGKMLGIPTSPGLAEVLSQKIPLSHAIQHTGAGSLTVLTAGQVAPAALPRLSPEKVQPLLRELRDGFDFVLIDAPHWTSRPDQLALGSQCDAIYLCVPEAQAEAPASQELLEVMTEQQMPVRGCVITAR